MSPDRSRHPAARFLRAVLLLLALLPAVTLPAAADNARRADAYFQKGLKAMKTGELSAAMDAFLRARTLSPDNPMPEIYLGHIAMERGEYDSAEQSYLRAIDLVRAMASAEQRAALQKAADDAEALDRLNLSSAHGVGSTGGPVAVQQQLTEKERREGTTRGHGFGLRAVEGATDNVPADLFMFLGNARVQGGHPADAVEAYREAAKRAPDAPEPLHNLAVALAQSGQLAKALEACARAEALGYEPAVTLHRQIERSLAASDPASGPANQP